MDVLKRQIMEPRASSPAGRVESNRRPSYGHARGAPSSVGNGVLEHLLLYCTYSSLRHYYSRALSRQSLINLAPAPSDVVPPAQFCPSQGHQRTASSSSLSQLDREGRSHKSSSPAHLPILSTHNAVVDVLFGQAQTRYIAPDRGAQGDAVWMLRLPVHPVHERMEVSTSHGHHLHQPPFPLTAHTEQPCTLLVATPAAQDGLSCPQGGPRCCPPHYCPAGISGKPSFTPQLGLASSTALRPKETGPPEHPITRELLGLPENLLEPCDGRAGRAPPAGLRMLGSWVLGSGLGALGSELWALGARRVRCTYVRT